VGKDILVCGYRNGERRHVGGAGGTGGTLSFQAPLPSCDENQL
jgi:hypothetical protein